MGRHKRELAEMCVQAVLAVADLERRDVNLDLIKVCLALKGCLGLKGNWYHMAVGRQPRPDQGLWKLFALGG